MSTRINFCPPKGYTSSISQYFLANQTDKFFTPPDRSLHTVENYFEGWDGQKVFVECSPFMLKIEDNENIKVPGFPVNFDNDYLIFNIRPYEKHVRSLFITIYFMEKLGLKFIKPDNTPSDLESVFLKCLYSYSIRLLKNGPVIHDFTGPVYFVQERDFDLNNILDLCGIEHDPIVLEKRHTSAFKGKQHEKEYKEVNLKWLEYFHKHRELFESIKTENVELLKNMELPLGDFDEQLYRYQFLK